MRVSSVREDLRAAFQYRLMAVLSIRLSMHGQRTIHHERRDFSDAPANHIRVSEGWCLNMTLELVNQHATCAREAIVELTTAFLLCVFALLVAWKGGAA